MINEGHVSSSARQLSDQCIKVPNADQITNKCRTCEGYPRDKLVTCTGQVGDK